MAKGLYIGVDGTAKKVKDIYIGINGVTRKVKKGYIGIDGVARQFYPTSQSGYTQLGYLEIPAKCSFALYSPLASSGSFTLSFSLGTYPGGNAGIISSGGSTFSLYRSSSTAMRYNVGASTGTLNIRTSNRTVSYSNGKLTAFNYSKSGLGFSGTANIRLFATGSGTSAHPGTFYSFTIKADSNSESVTYVPCRAEDGTLGIYNTHNGSFYKNSGTGTLVAGPVVGPLS